MVPGVAKTSHMMERLSNTNRQVGCLRVLTVVKKAAEILILSCLHVYLEVGLLDGKHHMVVLFFIFVGTSILFFHISCIHQH